MLRLLSVLILGVGLGACDPAYFVRSSGSISIRPDERMVLDALRADEIVRAARIEEGHIYARLAVPFLPGEQDEDTWISVFVERKDAFELEMRFEIAGIGFKPPAGVPERWQPILDGLRDRVLERCTERSICD
jgi:hypothetical protein